MDTKNLSYTDILRRFEPSFHERKTVCVQGLGFVGAAMAVAVARSRNGAQRPRYNVIGVDLDTAAGRERIGRVNAGEFPFATADKALQEESRKAADVGNIVATCDTNAFQLADIVVVDINLNLDFDAKQKPIVDFSGLRQAVKTVASQVKKGCLIIVETTVPPGTCRHVVRPVIDECLVKRGMKAEDVKLAHSYERVMPGKNYLDSIVNFWRVFASDEAQAADECRDFLSSIINVEKFPLRQLSSTVASETAKVLENSYRATTIAFMEEWGRFAESAGIDIFEIVDAIRVRPTHSNIRQPGFGVGGYCLTKDPLFAHIGARDLLHAEAEFTFSKLAVEKNNQMPLVTVNKVEKLLGKDARGKRVLLLGVSYREDVADTRYSPAEVFVVEMEKRGAKVDAHDPLVNYFAEIERDVLKELPNAENYDAIVLAVPHQAYASLDFKIWLGQHKAVVFDANNVLSKEQLKQLKATGHHVHGIGRG